MWLVYWDLFLIRAYYLYWKDILIIFSLVFARKILD